jgi:hypothetical protein
VACLAAALALAVGFDAVLVAGLAVAFEAAVGLAADLTAGFAAALEEVFGEVETFRLLGGVAGAWCRNPTNSAGSSLANSSCT